MAPKTGVSDEARPGLARSAPSRRMPVEPPEPRTPAVPREERGDGDGSQCGILQESGDAGFGCQRGDAGVVFVAGDLRFDGCPGAGGGRRGRSVPAGGGPYPRRGRCSGFGESAAAKDSSSAKFPETAANGSGPVACDAGPWRRRRPAPGCRRRGGCGPGSKRRTRSGGRAGGTRPRSPRSR